jgi:hypothetical protein
MKIFIWNIYKWLSAHRYIFGMNPKNWSEEDEIEYQKWAQQFPDWRGFYK